MKGAHGADSSAFLGVREPRGSGGSALLDARRPRGAGRPLLLCVAALGTVLAGCGGADPPPARERPEYASSARRAGGSSSNAATALRLSDVAAEAGIAFLHHTGAFGQKYMPETMGSGGGFLDYDRDGWPDLFLVDSAEWPGHDAGAGSSASRLYRNLGDGRFRDVSRETGIEALTSGLYGMGVAFADHDGDGDPDIYLTAVGTNRLLRNDGGRFTDVTELAGVSGNGSGPDDRPAWSTGAAWLDADRDGWLDLFVCNYVRWSPETDLFTTLDGENKSYATPQPYEGETCRLYRNRDGRRFEDVTREAGVLNPEGKSLGIAVEDFNDDGWPDLVVTNDTQPNFLYLNDGDGTFTDVGLQAGVAFDEFGRARAGMGVDVADVTGQGRLSIAIGNFSNEPISLYTQIGADLFQDLAGSARLTRPTLRPLTFGLLFVDLDRDGHEDLVVGNGHIEPSIHTVQEGITFAQRPQLFRNGGRGQFVEITDQVGSEFALPIVARGVAASDYDRDGDLDLLMTVNGGRPMLFRNELPATEGHWLRLELRGRAPNTRAVGAVVTLYAGGVTQRRMVRTGSSYLSQSELNPLLFGLGEADGADSVRVRWPTDGRVERRGPLEAGRTHVIEESRPSGRGVE
ncbi:MAG: CRTAC1 family protein [Gemmatimonadota bacterium]